MKKLSELMTMTDDLSSPETKPVVVLFDGVLDAGKLLHCQEIDTFANHFFGKPISAILGTDHNEELHDWLRDELYKANVQGRSMVYPIKARFEDLAHDTQSDEYSAPLYLFLFDKMPFILQKIQEAVTNLLMTYLFIGQRIWISSPMI